MAEPAELTSRRLAGVLSGGEQQMLGLGRALARRPKSRMVDDPRKDRHLLVAGYLGEVGADAAAQTIQEDPTRVP